MQSLHNLELYYQLYYSTKYCKYVNAPLFLPYPQDRTVFCLIS